MRLTAHLAPLGLRVSFVQALLYALHLIFVLNSAFTDSSACNGQVCVIGQPCIKCGWCPAYSACYESILDCTSWVPYNQSHTCPPITRTYKKSQRDFSLFSSVRDTDIVMLVSL